MYKARFLKEWMSKIYIRESCQKLTENTHKRKEITANR
jgi:hypothetical protein